jgi:Na+-driven multidrug efflux pump
MPYVAAGSALSYLGLITHKPYEYTGRTASMLYMCFISTMINIALNFIFLPKFGYIGAAYSTILSYLSYVVFTIVGAFKIMALQLDWLSILKKCFFVSLSFFFIALSRKIFSVLFNAYIDIALSCILSFICIYITLSPIAKKSYST